MSYPAWFAPGAITSKEPVAFTSAQVDLMRKLFTEAWEKARVEPLNWGGGNEAAMDDLYCRLMRTGGVMTDKWKLLKLLEEFGVEFREDRGNIVLEAGDAKVDGHPCFFVAWDFDKEDVFQCVGIWE